MKEFIEFLDVSLKDKIPKVKSSGVSAVKNLKDALKKGELFDRNVPKSNGAKYPKSKKDVLDLVPQKGYWRDLPLKIQKEFMGGSFHLGGGKTGIARRLER